MKNSFIILLCIISFCALGQTRQNINKNTGTVSNVLTTIDSIRFNGSSTTMEVVLQNGTVESHSISDIQNVNFISSSQHNCGADSVHNPNLNYGSMTDQEGNVYKTIVIGNKEWMAENLKTSHYRNGDIIPNISDSIQWSNISTGAWVFHNNDSQYECPYGKLYNWYAFADPRHVCPSGWHEPSNSDWDTLVNYLGGAGGGGKMKSTGLQYWISPNENATNESGFSGLPCEGRRISIVNESFSFSIIGYFGNWWGSASTFTSTDAWAQYLKFFEGYTGQGVYDKREGHSVRCLNDESIFDSASQHTCGAESVHNPAKTYDTMTDQQGNVYKTIVIGAQEWMAENLKTSIYRNGEPIATNLTDTEWANTINTQIGAFAFYNNGSQYDCPYGKLYNWYAVSDPRQLCPTGWHEPTDGEWTTLSDYLGGISVAGGKMKSMGLQYWIIPNSDATNESGFSGLPGVNRDSDGAFGTIGNSGSWWSSSEFGLNYSWGRYVNNYNGVATKNSYDKRVGLSVRCLKD